MKSKNVIKIPIGDWSGDGHNQSNDYYIISNYEVVSLQESYKNSCKLTGLQFNHNENYTGLKEHNSSGTERHICTEYSEKSLSDIVLKEFNKYNCPFKELLEDKFVEDSKEFVELLIWFISLSMPKDFEWSFLEFQCLNGYWNKNLNVQFGYGLFY